MTTTYRAMRVSASKLEIVDLPVPAPSKGQVLISVEACGICGADAADIERARRDLTTPRVPGHEVVGRIIAVGAEVPSLWQVGKRVGVGRLGGNCMVCEQCRQGHFQLCSNQPVLGVSQDGGYAEMMLARSTGLVAIPEELNSEMAAPLLCAGIATFNALKKSGAQAGDLVAIHGIGGLGHLAVQYARRMGFRVVALGRGSDIANEAIALGAHVYIDARKEDPAERLRSMGGAHVILTTVMDSNAVSLLVPALAPQGRLVIVGVGQEPLSIMPGMLVGGERTVQGTITGSAYESERTLDFSVMADVRPQIELEPLERANEALQRMLSGQAKFRVVLTMERNPMGSGV